MTISSVISQTPSNGIVWIGIVAIVAGMSLGSRGAAEGATPGEQSIRLVVRADDMGVAHAANEACIRSYREGIVRSVEVIVPGQWFLEAARMLNDNPQLDVGVHLTLTSEWEVCKWRPITAGKGLVDADGYFQPTTARFLEGKPKIEEVEAELRAQIELARKHIKNVSHVSLHMGTPAATPELRALSQKLAGEYKLIFEAPPGARGLRVGWNGRMTPDEKEQSLVAALAKLPGGLWLFIEHPGADVPEMRAMGHKGYENVAADREGVTRAFTSEKVRKILLERKITLMSYAEASQ